MLCFKTNCFNELNCRLFTRQLDDWFVLCWVVDFYDFIQSTFVPDDGRREVYDDDINNKKMCSLAVGIFVHIQFCHLDRNWYTLFWMYRLYTHTHAINWTRTRHKQNTFLSFKFSYKSLIHLRIFHFAVWGKQYNNLKGTMRYEMLLCSHLVSHKTSWKVDCYVQHSLAHAARYDSDHCCICRSSAFLSKCLKSFLTKIVSIQILSTVLKNVKFIMTFDILTWYFEKIFTNYRMLFHTYRSKYTINFAPENERPGFFYSGINSSVRSPRTPAFDGATTSVCLFISLRNKYWRWLCTLWFPLLWILYTKQIIKMQHFFFLLPNRMDYCNKRKHYVTRCSSLWFIWINCQRQHYHPNTHILNSPPDIWLQFSFGAFDKFTEFGVFSVDTFGRQ